MSLVCCEISRTVAADLKHSLLCQSFDVKLFIIREKPAFEMPSKSASDKEIWRWTETTSPDEVTEEHVRIAYRVNLPICSTSCRRNCKGNPNCLVNLGEKEWLKEIRDEHWYQMDDPEEEKRTKEDLVGLKNLGATCYVNTFLQVWFHNRQFREAIYKWRPLDKEWGKDQLLEDGVLAAIPDESLQPTSICGHLQLLFALLQFSKRRYIDPSNFINCLGLDAALQQDAQEFSKLLISLLEGTLKEQPNARVRNVIEQQFSGQYSYVTRCNHCGNCSERPSRFYELDLNIKGHKQLEDSLSEFLKEEKLEGANQYLCEKCNCKRNATRCIKLQTLPPVLNIQLLRFVFDRHSGTKKKLNNFLQFPEEIDMSKHLARRDKDAVYDLEAVLIHRGPTAYSGHYVAHIRSHGDGGVWFKFNDEEIQKMEGKNLKLGCEDELSAGKEGKRPKVPKGNHASKNAYMLVYKRRSTDQRESHVDNPTTTTSVESLPDYLQELIGRDNEKFEDWLREMVAMRTRNVESGRRMQQEIQTIYKQIHPEDDGKCDWIATEWLKKWLHEDETSGSKVGPINNYKFECKHKNLDPHKVKELKRISSKAADLLFAKYGSDGLQLRMTLSKMCLACVKQKCQVVRIQAQLVADQKFVTDNTKAKCQSEDGFWVGKDSLRQWKRMAVEKVESQFDGGGGGGATEGEEDMEIDDEDQALPNGKSAAAGATEGGENGAPPKENGERKDGEQKDEEEEEEEDEEPLVFNEDLLCPHGNLSTDMSQRRLVFAPVWEVLRKYFPESSEFKADSQPCLQCHLADAEDAEQAQQRCDLATELKKSLSQLFHGRSRPAWKKGESMEVYVAPLPFVEAWRSFLRHPVKADLPTDITNNAFICAHNGLILDPSTISPIDETSGVALVWPYEWEILKANFIVDQPIRIWKVIADEPCFITEPDLCQTCSQERQLAEHQARFTYSGVKLYIRKFMPEVGENAKAAINFLMEATSPGGSSDQENKDPDFQQTDPKRMKLELDNSSSSRRSSRHRRVRGEKEVMVSSTNTLKELKIKVMHAFSVAPFDQTLLYRGKPLQDNEATLSHLGVTPEALITLIVDSPICEDPLAMDEIARASSVPEAGFKGTGLQSS